MEIMAKTIEYLQPNPGNLISHFYNFAACFENTIPYQYKV